jgi:predicted nucleic acid-binding protein
MGAVRANCFDASALVKLYINEKGSHIIKNYFNSEPTKYTTPLCYYEAINLLKVKHFYRKEISMDDYHNATFNLTAWFSHIVKDIKDLDFLSPIVFKNVQDISKKYSLDLSDAFQILRAGFAMKAYPLVQIFRINLRSIIKVADFLYSE